MLLKIFQREWLIKIINGVLIICVFASLITYFDGFLKDHPHKFHLSILDEANLDNNHSHQSSQQGIFRQIHLSQYNFLTYANFRTIRNDNSNLSQRSCSESVYQESNINRQIKALLLPIAKLPVKEFLPEKSEWLSPPKKPPVFHHIVAI